MSLGTAEGGDWPPDVHKFVYPSLCAHRSRLSFPGTNRFSEEKSEEISGTKIEKTILWPRPLTRTLVQRVKSFRKGINVYIYPMKKNIYIYNINKLQYAKKKSKNVSGI